MSLETKMATMAIKVEDNGLRIERTESKVGEIHSVICGNGGVGVTEEIRGLKKWKANIMKVLWVLFTAVVAIGVATILQ